MTVFVLTNTRTGAILGVFSSLRAAESKMFECYDDEIKVQAFLVEEE